MAKTEPTTNLLVEKAPTKDAAFRELNEGDIVAATSKQAQALLQDGIVFCVTDEPATHKITALPSDKRKTGDVAPIGSKKET